MPRKKGRVRVTQPPASLLSVKSSTLENKGRCIEMQMGIKQKRRNGMRKLGKSIEEKEKKQNTLNVKMHLNII